MMKAAQLQFKEGRLSEEAGDEICGTGATLVLGFGSKSLLEQGDIRQLLKAKYPSAEIVLCSTSGEIYDDTVNDDTVSVVVAEFEKTDLRTVCINISDFADSFEAGAHLFDLLRSVDLSYVMVLSDGGLVNGSQLVQGIEFANKKNIPVTGGLAGDGANFDYTLVSCNDVPPGQGNIVGIGFYGNHLKIAHGSVGGWDIFGPEKKVTRSEANRLYEIDNKSALDLYKQYLGKYADELPGSALLFPLNVRLEGAETSVVRTILSIDNDEKCMVFAGDIPEGAYVRFMKANFDKLIDAATQAAGEALTPFEKTGDIKPRLALLISCVGRKLILGKRTDEEIEAVKEMLGGDTILSGFYSYGEISPLTTPGKCELHNQTMTITTFNEL